MAQPSDFADQLLADKEMRADAVNSLGKLAGEARAALPELLKIAEAEHAHRPICVVALGRIGPAAKNAVPYLRGLLKGTDEELVAQTIEALGLIEDVRSASDGARVTIAAADVDLSDVANPDVSSGLMSDIHPWRCGSAAVRR